MRIRAANAADLPAIAAVHRTAFAGTAMGYHGEGALVAALHDDGDALVSLVAEAEGRIIGHALFSRMSVEADGAPLRAAGLAPVAVLPCSHRSGIGSVLIRAGLDALTAAGCQISFVLGHPAYYPRFGYSAAAAAPFASPYAGPHFMALLLDKALQIPKSGRADYAAAFSR
jgi:putative acetyltransferase